MRNHPHSWNNPKGKGITWGRRIARFLSPCACYNPSIRRHRNAKYMRAETNSIEDGGANKRNKLPVLDQGWAYFEHIVLPRRFCDGRMNRANPGESEKETQLYSLWKTSLEDLGDFGDGIGLYFSSLRYFAFVTLVAGFINIPNMIFFASTDYKGRQEDVWSRFPREFSKWIIAGSAVCTDSSWQPCPTCTYDDWVRFPSTNDRFAFANSNTAFSDEFATCTSNTNITSSSSEGNILTFIKKNNCELHDQFGEVSIATMVFVLLAIYCFMFTLKRRAIDFDEAEQSTSDYSIVINNPPKNATDPDTWKHFIESQFENVHVTACTIAVDNNSLIKALLRRRKLLLQLQDIFPIEESFDENDLDSMVDKCHPIPCWKKWCGCASGAKDIVNNIRREEKQIKKLSLEKKYNATHIFITFETQHAQQRVLQAMSTPLLQKFTISKELRFDGNILKVQKAPEPSAIRWFDLSVSQYVKFLQRLITTIMTLGILCAMTFVILYARVENPILAPVAIVFFNAITPAVALLLTSFESHSNETSYTTSRYLKLTLFRWVNTAIITTIITPFTDTLQNGPYLIDSLYILFMAELVRRPIVQLPDVVGNFKRHILGPRALDQRRMNLNFQGLSYDIGERYTELIRILFLTFFYCTIFPASFFFTAVILAMAYILDKFSILRSWRQGPKISAHISILSSNFYLLILLVYWVGASYYYAQFPYDNACETEDILTEEYIGTHCAQFDDMNMEQTFKIVIKSDDRVYKFCNQEIIGTSRIYFPPLPSSQPEGSEWMTTSQESFSKIHGWASVVVILIVGLTFFLKLVFKMCNAFCCTRCKTSTEANDERFSNIPGIIGYVPKIEIPGHDFPFLLCDIDNIDEKKLVGCYDYLNSIIFDLQVVSSDRVRVYQTKKGIKVDSLQEKVEISLEEEDLTYFDSDGILSVVKVWKPVRNNRPLSNS